MNSANPRPQLAAVQPPQDTDSHRQAPHNLETEQALLGAILVNNEACDRVSGFLAAEHFYEGIHARIFDAASTLIRAGKLASPVTLKTFFETLSESDGAIVILPERVFRASPSSSTVIQPLMKFTWCFNRRPH